MPDYFTHITGAELIFEKLDAEQRKIISRDKTLYLLGAQGGDIFFFYGLDYRHNAGRMLHRMDAKELFEKLLKGNRAYCAGWATHYALDCTIHPFVYAYENTHRGVFLHQKYERDFGLYVSRKTQMRRIILPKEKLMECTLAVCDSIRNVLPYVTPAGTAACLKRHFIYTRRQFRTKKQEYTLNCNYGETYKAFERSLDLVEKAAECLLDGKIDAEIFSKSFLQK